MLPYALDPCVNGRIEHQIKSININDYIYQRALHGCRYPDAGFDIQRHRHSVSSTSISPTVVDGDSVPVMLSILRDELRE